jgi:hypothetical protein
LGGDQVNDFHIRREFSGFSVDCKSFQ